MSFLLYRLEWKAGSIFFLIKWGLEVHEFRETFIFDRSRLITNSLSNLQVTCNVQNSGFACDFSQRRNLTRQRSYHSRYKTKRWLIGGILLNSGVALCFRRWTSGSTHSLISVSDIAIMGSLSMPMLVTHFEMESCLCDFKIRNQIETCLKDCWRQYWFFFVCLLSEPLPRENFIADTEAHQSGVSFLSFLNKTEPNGGTDGNY